jgi:hypothetical protein
MAVWKIWKVEGITFFLRIPKGSVSGRMMLFFLFTMKMWLWVKAHVIPWWKQTNVACFFNAFRINHHIWYNSCWYNRFGLIPIYIYDYICISTWDHQVGMGRPMYATIGCLWDQGYQGELKGVIWRLAIWARPMYVCCLATLRKSRSKPHSSRQLFHTRSCLIVLGFVWKWCILYP